MSREHVEGLNECLLACDHDRSGREAEAIPHYERALALGLPPQERCGALVGLGSSLRNVRRFREAVTLLTDALRELPGDASLQAFLALALYSNRDQRSAMVELLDLAIRHAPVGVYARALTLYRDELA